MPFGCGVSICCNTRRPVHPPLPPSSSDQTNRPPRLGESSPPLSPSPRSEGGGGSKEPSELQECSKRSDSLARGFFNRSTNSYLARLTFIEDTEDYLSKEGNLSELHEDVKSLPPKMRVFDSFASSTIDFYRFSRGIPDSAQMLFSLNTNSGVRTRGSIQFDIRALDKTVRMLLNKVTSLSLELKFFKDRSPKIFLTRAAENGSEEGAEPLELMGINTPNNNMFESYALVFPDFSTQNRSFLLLHPRLAPRMTSAR